MTDEEARKLATRCIDTWPSGPRAYVWRDILLDLDAAYAAAAYRKLAESAERAPTPGQLLTAYHAARAAARRRAVQPELPPAEEEVLGPDHPRAIAAFERGLAQGRAELARMRAAREEAERADAERRAARRAAREEAQA